MKRIFFCIVINILCLNYLAQAQCRVIAPDAEEWIENNREKIAKMTRPEWQELEEGYKWIVFTKVSAKQKHDFFRLKIEQVRDCFEWEKEEKEHIEKLYQFFVDNPDLYSEERDEKKVAGINEFLKRWVEQAMENLKWTPVLIQGIVMTCEDLLDKDGNIRLTTKFDEVDIRDLIVEFIDRDGNAVTNQDFVGKYTILDFWNTSCGVCFREFPKFEELYGKYQSNKDLAIYAVNMKLPRDKAGAAFEVISEEGYSFPVLQGGTVEDAKNIFGITVYPTVIVLDKTGTLVFRGDLEKAFSFVETMLKKE